MGAGTGFSQGGGSSIQGVVNNYDALPPANTVSGQYYWVSNSQGTKWLPWSLGGTFYPNGLYYSNGTTWEFLEVPYQATLATVNQGTNGDQFVTPYTFTNSDLILNINENISDIEKSLQVASLYSYIVFIYDVDDNITQKKIYTDNTMTTQLFDVIYTYSSGNITNIQVNCIYDTFVYNKQFTYDINGNITNITII